MANALTGPHAVAALVLCVAGIAKLRAPGPAAAAVSVPRWLVRAFAAYEVGLGVVALAWPPVSPLLALTYGALAAVTLILARRAASCGCFGEGDAPASTAQSALSLVMAGLAVLPAHGASWIVARPAPGAAVLVLGVGAAVYGVVVAYAEIPTAWRAWSAP